MVKNGQMWNFMLIGSHNITISLTIHNKNYPSQKKVGRVFSWLRFSLEGCYVFQNCHNSPVIMMLLISNGLLLSWQFCKEKTQKIWMLPKFFIIKVLVSLFLLWTYFMPCYSVSIVNFEQIIAGWKSVARRIQCTLDQKISRILRWLLQNVTKMYCKVWQVVQRET